MVLTERPATVTGLAFFEDGGRGGRPADTPGVSFFAAAVGDLGGIEVFALGVAVGAACEGAEVYHLALPGGLTLAGCATPRAADLFPALDLAEGEAPTGGSPDGSVLFFAFADGESFPVFLPIPLNAEITDFGLFPRFSSTSEITCSLPSSRGGS